ncbi:hypothetical protein [unidentified bacterial endosymbiont]|uniref:hypothetical protein n=1 Tax=unidentified bacterial endosymbiont TaxID=2355 RepID=UPI00209E22E4|nr:hypothetical protein [unidentified bacterial endosymbiont]
MRMKLWIGVGIFVMAQSGQAALAATQDSRTGVHPISDLHGEYEGGEYEGGEHEGGEHEGGEYEGGEHEGGEHEGGEHEGGEHEGR